MVFSGWTGWRPCLRRSPCAGSSSGRRRPPSCSAGCSPRTWSAPVSLQQLVRGLGPAGSRRLLLGLDDRRWRCACSASLLCLSIPRVGARTRAPRWSRWARSPPRSEPLSSLAPLGQPPAQVGLAARAGARRGGGARRRPRRGSPPGGCPGGGGGETQRPRPGRRCSVDEQRARACGLSVAVRPSSWRTARASESGQRRDVGAAPPRREVGRHLRGPRQPQAATGRARRRCRRA